MGKRSHLWDLSGQVTPRKERMRHPWSRPYRSALRRLLPGTGSHPPKIARIQQTLWTAIALGTLGLAQPVQAIWPFDSPEQRTDVARETAELLTRMSQIPTINPPDDERPLAELLVRRLKSEGIESRLIPTPPSPESADDSRAAVWPEFRGRASATH